MGAGIIHTKTSQIGCLLRLEPNLQAQVRPLEEIAKYAEVCFYCGVTQTVGHVDPKCSSSVSFSRCAHVRSPDHPIHTHDVSSPREVPGAPFLPAAASPRGSCYGARHRLRQPPELLRAQRWVLVWLWGLPVPSWFTQSSC